MMIQTEVLRAHDAEVRERVDHLVGLLESGRAGEAHRCLLRWQAELIISPRTALYDQRAEKL